MLLHCHCFLFGDYFNILYFYGVKKLLNKQRNLDEYPNVNYRVRVSLEKTGSIFKCALREIALDSSLLLPLLLNKYSLFI